MLRILLEFKLTIVIFWKSEIRRQGFTGTERGQVDNEYESKSIFEHVE